MMIWLATLSFMTLAVVVLTILIRYRSFVLSLIMTPLLIFGVGFSWQAYQGLGGRPIKEMPADGSKFVHGVEARPWIYLWVIDESGPRLHQVPWSEKNQKTVEDAARKSKSGKVMQFRKKGDRDSDAPFEFYQWQYNEALPKPSVNN